jgi:hypothetical protein
MKNFGAKWLALAAMSAAVAGMGLNGCGGGDNGTGTGGTGGAGGKGGTTGAAGKGGTTGTAGTGGSNAGTGGSTGMAGKGGTTGTAGTGGATGGSGGNAGANGGLPCPGLATFDSTIDSFQLNTYAMAGNLANNEAGAKATLAFNATEGDPLPGSLKIDAPFSDYNQYVDAQRVYTSTTLKNWTGMKLHVRVKVASGGNPSSLNPMGVQPYVNTGATFGGYCGKYVNLKTGNGWNDYILDLAADCAGSGADPSMVIAFGVSLQAGSGTDGDGGVNSMRPTMAAIYIDSFWLEGSCGGTGGSGGSTGAGGKGGTGGATGGSGGATGGAGGATGGSGGATGGAGGATGGSGGASGHGGGVGGVGGTTGGIGGAGGVAGTTGGIGGAAGGVAGAAGVAGAGGSST